MKYFLVMCLAIAAVQAALTPYQFHLLDDHKTKCLDQTKADPNRVEKLKDGDFRDVNDSLKAYALCMLVESRLMDAHGNFHKEVAVAKTFIPEDKPVVNQVFTECMKSVSGSLEDIGWEFATCFYKLNQDYSVFH